MALPTPAAQPNYFIRGTVEVMPGVAIAEGVILEADSDSRLIVSTGVCLGSDLVIQARWGTLIIEAGVNLGRDVVIVGHGRIGPGACIGAGSTLVNPKIPAYQVLPPKSLVEGMPTISYESAGQHRPAKSPDGVESSGLNGKSAGESSVSPSSVDDDLGGTSPEITVSQDDGQPNEDGQKTPREETGLIEHDHTVSPEGLQSSGQEHSPPSESSESSTRSNFSHVYGREQVNRLLDTLFPHRRPLQGESSNGAKPEVNGAKPKVSDKVSELENADSQLRPPQESGLS